MPASVAQDEQATDDESQEKREEQKEKETKKKRRLLPIPVFITEPAVSYGLGGAVAYFHRKPKDSTTTAPALTKTPGGNPGNQKKPPPDITGIAAAWTENSSFGAGAGHFGSWRKDSIRYTGVVAYTDLELDYYLFDEAFKYELEMRVLYQDVMFRLGSSDTFLGSRLALLDTQSVFNLDQDEEEPVDEDSLDVQDVGLALTATYDTRDNTFTPNDGRRIELAAWRYDEAFGGDFNFWKFNIQAISFHPIGKRFVLGLRLEATSVDGEPPFYGFLFVKLRGSPPSATRTRGSG